MATTQTHAISAVNLSYSDLEMLLIEITAGSRTSVASRFRKLRPRFGVDGLLTRTGNRVSYDVARVLSISAIYLVNGSGIPQGHAVEIVLDNWPEVARAAMRAAVDAGITTAPDGMPEDASGVAKFYVNSLMEADDGSIQSWASNMATEFRGSYISVDFFPVVLELVSVCEREGASASLKADFEALAKAYGWTKVADLPVSYPRREGAFFSEGPYFRRAKSLICADPSHPLSGWSRMRLQAFLSYVENPAPVDDFKRMIGRANTEPRLWHLLGAIGHELGLKSSFTGTVDTLLVHASAPRARALALIDDAERRGEPTSTSA